MDEVKETTGDDFIKLAEEMTGEKQTDEDMLAEMAKSRNLADIDELINYASIKKKLFMESMGFYVEYCPLRTEDRIEINSINDDNADIQRDKRNRRAIYLLLNRADDRYTEEKVNGLAATYIDAIMLEYDMQEDTRFLQPILKKRSDGLRQILRRKNTSS